MYNFLFHMLLPEYIWVICNISCVCKGSQHPLENKIYRLEYRWEGQLKKKKSKLKTVLETLVHNSIFKINVDTNNTT